jgi:hypothetical protein
MSEVRIVLLSDPDLPAELADRLADELPGLLAEHVAGTTRWRVDRISNPLAGDEQVSVTLMADVVGSRLPGPGWDLAICLTDLPRRSGHRPVVAELSSTARVALVSLPALGTLRLYPRVRAAVVHLVTELLAAEGARRARPRRTPLGLPERSGDEATVFLLPWPRGQLRLLAGMVRANRPWRLFLGLSKALAGVFAAAAFALLNSSVWQLAPALGPVRQTVLAVLSVVVLGTWLIADHELWERPATPAARERARLYNAATVVTLALGVMCLYATLAVLLTGTVALTLDAGVLGAALGHPPGWPDYAAIVWMTTSASMVGGALGAGLEDDTAVRLATYGERQRRRQQQLGDAAAAALGDSDAA